MNNVISIKQQNTNPKTQNPTPDFKSHNTNHNPFWIFKLWDLSFGVGIWDLCFGI